MSHCDIMHALDTCSCHNSNIRFFDSTARNLLDDYSRKVNHVILIQIGFDFISLWCMGMSNRSLCVFQCSWLYIRKRLMSVAEKYQECVMWFHTYVASLSDWNQFTFCAEVPARYVTLHMKIKGNLPKCSDFGDMSTQEPCKFLYFFFIFFRTSIFLLIKIL